MPKKRTKKQKVRATYHYAYPAGRSFVGLEPDGEKPAKTPAVEKHDVSSLYQYDPKYIRQDLLQTLLVTIAMITLELGLYFWL
jgi:hypothetical protein